MVFKFAFIFSQLKSAEMLAKKKGTNCKCFAKHAVGPQWVKSNIYCLCWLVLAVTPALMDGTALFCGETVLWKKPAAGSRL